MIKENSNNNMHGTTILAVRRKNNVVIAGDGQVSLGNKKSIKRYGNFFIPMDETLTRVSIDLSNRPYLIWKVKFTNKQIGKMDSELFKEWFQAFSQAAGITLHVENLYGDNNHHIIETCYKGLARSLRDAISVDPREKGRIPSTKGKL